MSLMTVYVGDTVPRTVSWFWSREEVRTNARAVGMQTVKLLHSVYQLV